MKLKKLKQGKWGEHNEMKSEYSTKLLGEKKLHEDKI